MIGAEKLEQLQHGGGGTMGASRPRIGGMALNQLTSRSSGPVSFGYSELENNNAQQASILTDFASQTTPGVDKSNTTLRNELPPPSSSPNSKVKVGGWINATSAASGGDQETSVVDLEVEEEDIDPAVIEQDDDEHQESPEITSPLSRLPNKSQTKT